MILKQFRFFYDQSRESQKKPETLSGKKLEAIDIPKLATLVIEDQFEKDIGKSYK